MGPKITKQGASFPEDEPGTPKLLPGDGGDRSARIHRAEATERPGEQGERFADLNQGERVESGENQPEQPGADQVQGRHAVPGDPGDQVENGEQDPDRQPEVEDDERETPETYEGAAWPRDVLQAEAGKRGLPTGGNKGELAARLREHDQAAADSDSS